MTSLVGKRKKNTNHESRIWCSTWCILLLKSTINWCGRSVGCSETIMIKAVERYQLKIKCEWIGTIEFADDKAIIGEKELFTSEIGKQNKQNS